MKAMTMNRESIDFTPFCSKCRMAITLCSDIHSMEEAGLY